MIVHANLIGTLLNAKCAKGLEIERGRGGWPLVKFLVVLRTYDGYVATFLASVSFHCE